MTNAMEAEFLRVFGVSSAAAVPIPEGPLMDLEPAELGTAALSHSFAELRLCGKARRTRSRSPVSAGGALQPRSDKKGRGAAHLQFNIATPQGPVEDGADSGDGGGDHRGLT